MRILLLAHERTASKMVLHNLHRYLQAGNIPPVECIFNNESGPWHEPLRTCQVINTAGGDVVALVGEQPDTMTTIDIIRDRLPVIRRIRRPFVMKVHHELMKSDEEQQLLMEFDHVIHLKRRDTFSQTLSFVLSLRHQTWIPDERQRNITELLINNPVQIDPKQIDWEAHRFIRGRKLEIPNTTTIWTEDVQQVRTASEFCDMLNLPYHEFALDVDTKEYGDSKSMMISNLEEVKQAFDAVETKLG